jgi:EAL domain-containing protein (putative c-di-GMP-specific phosphodiesterase class I)
MIDLAHSLGLSATAEGVETVEQLRFLRALRCDVAQGFLVAAPLEPDALVAWKSDFERRWPQLIA